MKRTLWFVHPIAIFVFSIITLGLSLFLYIYWYMEVSTGLKAVIQKYNLDPDQFASWQTWVVILIMSILVAIILLGIFLIFVYQRKTLSLYRSQHKFINSFTHELKTPTTSLQLYLETFAKHELPRDKQLKYIDYMLADVGRLSDNINGILNLARIEAKIFGGDFVVVDMVQEIKEFYANNAQLFRGSTIQVINKRKHHFHCSINHSLFQMLLMNLFTNGIRHNESTQPEIEVSFSQSDKNVLIHFTDNGVGFEKSQRKNIFMKFFQIKRTNWNYAGGTGLGLYMAEQVIRLHKGKISAHSEGEGKGACFTVSLPRQKTEQTQRLDQTTSNRGTT